MDQEWTMEKENRTGDENEIDEVFSRDEETLRDLEEEARLAGLRRRKDPEPEESEGETLQEDLREKYSGMTDEEVVMLSHQGENLAEEYLLDKYKNFVRSKARSYFLIGADHEDIVQEGMIGLYKAIRDYRPEKLSSFHAFAELCITRQIITAIKTATRQKHIPLNSYISLNKPLYD